MNLLVFYIQLADKYFLSDSLEFLECVVAQQFRANHYSSADFYLDIPKESFCRILHHPQFSMRKEYEVYIIAKKWLQHEEERLKYASDIMGVIRFALIPKHLLQIQISEDPVVQENENIATAVSTAIEYHSNIYKQPMYTGKLNEPRGTNQLFCISPSDSKVHTCSVAELNWTVEIEDTIPITYPIQDDSQQASKWQESMRLACTFPPFVDKTLFMLQHGYFLFILGVHKSFMSNIMYRYNPFTEQCISLVPVPGFPLGGAAVARTDRFILVAGGMEVNHDTIYDNYESNYSAASSNAFVYEISENGWIKVLPVPQRVVDAAACELNGMIYLAGGNNPESEGKISNTWAYNFISKSWIPKASMSRPRADFILEAVQGNLYAVGTSGETAFSGVYIEMYEPHPNMWTRIDMNAMLDISRATSLVFSDLIFILAGEEGGEDCSEMIFVVDILNRRTELVNLKLPKKVHGQVGAIVNC